MSRRITLRSDPCDRGAYTKPHVSTSFGSQTGKARWAASHTAVSIRWAARQPSFCLGRCQTILTDVIPYLLAAAALRSAGAEGSKQSQRQGLFLPSSCASIVTCASLWVAQARGSTTPKRHRACRLNRARSHTVFVPWFDSTATGSL